MNTKLAPGLLVATPHLQDPNFDHTVILLFEHSAKGAVGLVVNRELELGVGQVLEDLEIPAEGLPPRSVQYGGPVSMEIGWVIHTPDYREASTRVVTDAISVSTSREVLEALAAGGGPSRYMLCLGYAGWGGGQLEDEVAEGAWLTLEAEPDLLFRVDADDRWRRAYEIIGIDPFQLAATVGNA